MNKRVKKNILIWACVVWGILFWSVLIAAFIYSSEHPEEQIAVTPPCTVNAAALLTHIQDERAKLGAPILTSDNLLAQSSREKLDDMIANKYYGHDLTDGSAFSTLIRDKGIKASISEDLGSSDNNADQSWDEFKNSPEHYKSLTDPTYTRIGISTQCTDYMMEKSTGPTDNSSMVGQKITDLTVIHLAGPEPVAPVPTSDTQQTRSRTSCVSTPTYSYADVMNPRITGYITSCR